MIRAEQNIMKARELESIKREKDHANNAQVVKTIEAMRSNDESELEKLRLQETKIKEELNLKNKQLNETIRHNIETEKISRVKSVK